MAEEDSSAAVVADPDTAPAAPDMEAQIKTAMKSRVAHFKQQSDSLTLGGVRRLIEKDLGLETQALDVHKRFIKQCLMECLEGNDNMNASKDPETPNDVPTYKGDAAESPEKIESNKEPKEPGSDNEEKMEDSPVMGLLGAHEVLKSDAKELKGNGNKTDITDSLIMKAIKKRASYFKANAESVTMAGARRLLEGDLGLDKHALDPHKGFIGVQLEKILESPEPPTSKNKAAAETDKRSAQRKGSKKVAKEAGSDSSNSEDEMEEEDMVRKKKVNKGRMQKLEAPKKRKTPPSKEEKATNKKRTKPETSVSYSNSEKQDSEHDSDDESQSSARKRSQKKEISTPVYGKRVENLKSVIKSCGLSIPPTIYRKAKQVSEDKRESVLIKELEEILSREGLSSNPSEKEIKDVKKRKERQKELEGIDTSNIVTSSRRRSTYSYVPPPKPEIPAESEGEESEDTDEDDDDDDDDDEDNEENDEGGDGSQSEDVEAKESD